MKKVKFSLWGCLDCEKTYFITADELPNSCPYCGAGYVSQTPGQSDEVEDIEVSFVEPDEPKTENTADRIKTLEEALKDTMCRSCGHTVQRMLMGLSGCTQKSCKVYRALKGGVLTEEDW